MKPDTLHGIVAWLLLAGASFWLIDLYLGLGLYLTIFVSLNVATFVLMVLDKFFASTAWRRIPENVFYLVTFLGGSIGMLLGMYVFKHKTRKTSFQFVVALLLVIQIGAILWLAEVF